MSNKVPFVDEVEIFNDAFSKPNNYQPTIPHDKKLTNFVVDFITTTGLLLTSSIKGSKN